MEAIQGRSGPDIQVLLLVLPLAAVVMVVMHLPSIAGEVRLGRLATPPRVRQEEAELAGTDQRAPEPVVTNPWGDTKPVESEEEL
jgi:hypothetical protein